MILSNYW